MIMNSAILPFRMSVRIALTRRNPIHYTLLKVLRPVRAVKENVQLKLPVMQSYQGLHILAMKKRVLVKQQIRVNPQEV